MSETIQIKIPPHHNAITKSGSSHFSRVPDAVAEFIDNAIQACNDNLVSRTIIVYFFLGAGGVGYMCISDDGDGMNVPGVECLSTYGLDQKTRNLVNTGAVSISKFGVGAKQAGFYLGERIHIITKQAGVPTVLETILDEKEFDARYANNEDVYCGVIKRRRVNDTTEIDNNMPADQKAVRALYQTLVQHERDNDQFTSIVIKLNAVTVAQMLDNQYYLDLKDDIAEIYHFHLHPEHHPTEIHKLPKFQAQGGFGGYNFASARQSTQSSPKLTSLPDLNIIIKVNVLAPDVLAVDINLRTLSTDKFSRCVNNAKSVFCFALEIPDPNPSEDSGYVS